MPRHSRVFAKQTTLPKNYAAVVEARLEEFERHSSFDSAEMAAVWADVLPEGAPERKPDGRVVLTGRMQDALEMILRDCKRRPDNACTADDWVLLTRMVLPEFYADPVRKCRATDALPGTPEKCQTLEMRAWMQLWLWHEMDPRDHSAVEHAVCPARRRKPAQPKDLTKCAPAEKPTRQEEKDAKRGQARLWYHEGMIRLDGWMEWPDRPKAEYESGRGRASEREACRTHAG